MDLNLNSIATFSRKTLLPFQNFKPKRLNKSEMSQNLSQTQGTIFHSSACISSSEGFFQKSLCTLLWQITVFWRLSSQIAILLSLGLKFLRKWKPTYIYGDLNFSDSQQVFANLFSWRKLEGFADHFLKISRSHSSGNSNYSNFPHAEPIGQLWCLAPKGLGKPYSQPSCKNPVCQNDILHWVNTPTLESCFGLVGHHQQGAECDQLESQPLNIRAYAQPLTCVCKLSKITTLACAVTMTTSDHKTREKLLPIARDSESRTVNLAARTRCVKKTSSIGSTLQP